MRQSARHARSAEDASTPRPSSEPRRAAVGDRPSIVVPPQRTIGAADGIGFRVVD